MRLTTLTLTLALAAPAAFGQETTGGPASREVRPLDASALRAELEARHGQYVILNMWATWCPPCVAEFPDLVTFAHEVSGENVAVMAISSDYAADLETLVYPFLAEQDPPFPVFLQDDSDTVFYPVIDPEWGGSYPHTVVYRPDGSIGARTGEFGGVPGLREALASAEAE